MMTPQFARVATTRTLELEVQMGLSLAVRGSHSKLNYGAWADLEIGPIKVKNYFDLVNLDHHDVVLGTPFLWAHGLTVVFEEDGYLIHKGRRLSIPNVIKKPRRPDEDIVRRTGHRSDKFFRAPERS